MTDRPIIFIAPMVRALLDGRKTQTRRVLTHRNTLVLGERWGSKSPWSGLRFNEAFARTKNPMTGVIDPHLAVPFCHPADEPCPSAECGVYRVRHEVEIGDRLWVRESLKADRMEIFLTGERTTNAAVAYYAADDSECLDPSEFNLAWVWKNKALPSIHMPRTFSRLTLVVEGVKVERLQDISEDDAIAEGMSSWQEPVPKGIAEVPEPAWHWQERNAPGRSSYFRKAAHAFSDLWMELHGMESRQANQWVAAITFRVEKRNIDAEQRIAA